MDKKEIPKVGFFKFLQHARNIVKNPLPFHHHNFEKNGDIFKLAISPSRHVIFNRNPDFLRYVLQKNQRNYTKSKIQTKDLKKYVGNGLLTNEGNSWKRQRKLIQPAFHKKQLALLLDSMNTVIKEEVAAIPLDTPVDIFPICNNLAFKVVAKSLFSSNVDDVLIERLQYITEEAQKMLVKELRQPFLGWYFKYFGPIAKHIALTKEAGEILLELVKERKANAVRYDDLLDMLLDARYEDGSEMEQQQLIDEILILFVAGHETTSNALTFALYLLAMHPEEQKKLQQASLEAQKEAPTLMEFLRAHDYGKQVVEETMRLYPPVYFIDRVNLEEDSFDGFDLPAQSDLLFSVIEMHRHPKYWDQPEEFRPSRFADNAGMKHRAYFPFGAGPRMCIGNNFAMYEMILTLTEVVAQFKIKSSHSDITIKPLITLKPKEAVLEFSARV